MGLTGTSGSGKSTVRKLLEQEGLASISADALVSFSYEPGQDGWQILRHYFGTKFVPSATAPVDKHALYAAMQASESMRREIERLIHPVARQAVVRFHEAQGTGISVAEIPLLLEAGLQADHDLIVTVFCPDTIRQARLDARGWDAARRARMDSWQWDQSAKIRAAHLVVDNAGTPEDLARRVQGLARVVRHIQRHAQERELRTVRALLTDQSCMCGESS